MSQLDQQAILNAFQQTTQSNAVLIKQAEKQLHELEKIPGFCLFLLQSISDDSLSLNIRMSSAIYLKNKILKTWNDKLVFIKKDHIIQEDEKSQIKSNLIRVLITQCNNSHLRPHLTESIRSILIAEQGKWDLTETTFELLSGNNQDLVYTGLLVMFEFCKFNKWNVGTERVLLDKFIDKNFPLLESFAQQLVNNADSDMDYHSGELLYLILKCFKYGCLVNYPTYFAQEEGAFDRWIQLHLVLCKIPLPQQVLALDSMDRSLDKRCKVNKWTFGNLNRMLQRYHRSTKVITENFVQHVLTNIVPHILNEYFQIIEMWGSNKLWLSEGSLYHMIEFITKTVTINELWALIQPHLEAILTHVVVPSMSSTDESVALYEEDPEEYIRRYFDQNREGSTPDVAASNLVFAICIKRFDEIGLVLTVLQNIFTNFNVTEKYSVYKEEAGLKILGIAAAFLYNFERCKILTPQDFEGIYENCVLPILKLNGQCPFLCARALETLAATEYEFQNMGLLSQIFQEVYLRFMGDDGTNTIDNYDDSKLPIEIEAADALSTLVICNPSIKQHIGSQVPSMVEKLLKLSKIFEIDLLSEVIEVFVERFSDELSPFAQDLASNLAQQYIKVATDMINNSNNGATDISVFGSGKGGDGDNDQELQASALLTTMTTMVMSMGKVSLISVFKPVVKFVILNAQIEFLSETMDLFDSLMLSSKALYGGFNDDIWELYCDIIDSFQTYGLDYFDNYEDVLETVATYGFQQQDGSNTSVKPEYIQAFLQVINQVYDLLDSEFFIESCFGIMCFYALSNKDITLLDKTIQVFFTIKNKVSEDMKKSEANDENDDDLYSSSFDLDNEPFTKYVLACLVVKPIETVQTLEQTNSLLPFVQTWLDCDFKGVFVLKLQILAILNIFKLPQFLPPIVQPFLNKLSENLVSSIEKVPAAIRNHEAIVKGEGLSNGGLSEDTEFYDQFDDDFKESCLDQINVFQEVHSFFSAIAMNDQDRYAAIIGSLNQEKLDSLKVILDFVAGK
ncbi:related to Importin beta SMX1 [Saccharomycodes ludwigii]|uniref:Related to Importin beta SMX1 n=1 Tax=Saccharomycodes ludwigii TaxID=36035 RepID=A0A376B4M1_9ASCO|nr:hypothetical protein SCDLUD_003267 [Saccharomycodes ludwigii]KAH3900295.1 hypothetical protein SCDLUD_003267 [Saccharomycodes ludwigii]SSD59638.1 related to Importin beta SMX1 [Saccharomycodes ludwigii]